MSGVDASRAPAPATGPGPSTPRFSLGDIGLFLALSVLWGSAYIFIRQGLLLGATPILYASVRYVLSAAAFFLIAAVRREGFPSRRALLVSGGIGGTLFIGMYGGLLYWGELYTTGGYASVLASTSPILTVVVAYSILPAERLGRLGLVGILVGFLGVVVLVLPDLSSGSVGRWPGPLLIVVGFVGAAAGTVLLRRLGGGRQGLWQIGTQFGVGGLLLLAVGAVLPVREALPLTADLGALLGALVVFSSVLGYFVYFTLHHRVGPVRANLVAYLLPIVGIGIGSGLFGEALTVWEVLGFLVVVAGVTLVTVEKERAPPAPRPDGR